MKPVIKTQVDKEYKENSKKSLVFSTYQEEHFSSKNTLKILDNAITSAKSVQFPNRWYLLEIYEDIKNDAHLKSQVKHRKTRVKGLEYSIIKSNGKKDDKSTAIFNQSWFKKFLNYALDALFYGNSLIEVMNNRGDINITLIPRENVIPEFQQIKTYPGDLNGSIDYSAPIYEKQLVDINDENDKRNLGEYLSVAKLVLFKNEILLNWNQYAELFGQPFRVATTDSEDPQEMNQILTFLKELGRSGYLVKNSNTEIDLIESGGKSSSSSLYSDLEKYLNEEISKSILGGTMITDSGSSRSQSEVHLQGSYLYTKEDISFIEDIINNKLMPILKRQGIITSKNIEFKFNEPEILTVEQKLEVDMFLMNNFKVKDIEYFEKRYGVSLEYLPDELKEDFSQLKQEMSFANGSNRYDLNINLEDA